MTTPLAPASIPELVDAVRSTPRLLAVGAGGKSRLCAVDAVKLSMTGLRGIIEYEPAEFTFTAMAGTPLREIMSALDERGQYLPFDPMLTDGGGTLGGAVASGLSGPGRFRFGGVRDFILGARFVDGSGRLLRMGGKVVKNAAGFDLPKFFVGSLGRFGVLAELTFKVFPRPAASVTLKLECPAPEEAVRLLIQAANSRWEPEALDLPFDGGLSLRLAGPAAALGPLSREILARWPGRALDLEEAELLWTGVREFRWAHPDGALVKAPLIPRELPRFQSALGRVEGARLHVSAGGNQAFVSLPSPAGVAALEAVFRDLNMSAVTLRGSGPLWWGVQKRSKLARAVKQVMDPAGRFPPLEDAPALPESDFTFALG